jgi:PAS domain S-box-containing protein
MSEPTNEIKHSEDLLEHSVISDDFLNGIAFPYIILDQKGIVLDANQDWLKMFVYDCAANKHVSEFLYFEEIKNFSEHFEKVLINGYNRIRGLRVVNSNMKKFTADIELKTFRDERNEFLKTICLFRSFDELTHSVASDFNGEKKIKNLLSEIPGYVIVYRNEKIVYVNEDVGKILNLSPDKLLGANIFDFIAEEYAISIKERIGKMYAGIKIDDFEIDINSPDGKKFSTVVRSRLFDFEGEPSVLTVLTDITKRKEVEAALKKSEKLYKIISENTTDVIWMMDLGLKNIYVSPSIERFTGYTIQEHLAQTIEDRFTKDSAAFAKRAFAEQIKRFFDGEIADPQYSVPIELEYQCKNGSTKWGGIVVSVLYDDNGKAIGIHGVTRDITLKKATQLSEYKLMKNMDILNRAALKFVGVSFTEDIYKIISKELQANIENSIVIVNSFDPKTSELTVRCVEGIGRIIKYTLKMLGRSPLGMTFKANKKFSVEVVTGHVMKMYGGLRALSLEQIPVSVASMFESFIDLKEIYVMGIARNKKVFGTIAILICKKETGIDTHFVETFINQASIALQRVFVENELKEQEELYQKLIESSPDAICLFDKDGALMYISSKGLAMFGYNDNSEVVGRKITDFTSPVYESKMNKALYLIRVNENSDPEVFQFLRKDGSLFYGEIHSSFVKDSSGNIKNFISVIRDVTEKQKDKIELEETRRKAEEATMLKSTFLSNMSHEIRTPVNAIVGFAQLLADENFSDEKKVEFTNIINDNSRQLLKLVDDVIDFSKIEAGKVTVEAIDTNIMSVLQEMYTLFLDQLQKMEKPELELIVNLPSEIMPNIITDSFRLKQILSNLIGNAIKFTQKGKVEFGFMKHNKDSLRFYVKDTGVGMTNEQKEKLFSRFTQADETITRQYGGSGLGLSISKGLVKLLNGDIWVDSELGIGSVFNFTIPIKYSKKDIVTIGISENQVKIEEIDWCKYTVLVVEDHLVNFKILEKLLSRVGVKVMHVTDGKDAVDITLRVPEIDLILMDIQLPVMDGYEATRQIKKFRNDLPIIAQTAYAMSHDREKCIAAGCDDYLAKPMVIKEFYSTLSRYLK